MNYLVNALFDLKKRQRLTTFKFGACDHHQVTQNALHGLTCYFQWCNFSKPSEVVLRCRLSSCSGGSIKHLL